MALTFGKGPQWGRVLQEPNIGVDYAGPANLRDIWAARQSTMQGAQSTALSELNAALQAQRDKALADYIAANTPRAGGGGGRGGGGGGGGGKAPPVFLPDVPLPDGWYQPAPSITAPPGAPAALMPSSLYGANNVYSFGGNHPKPPTNRGAAARNRPGVIPKKIPKFKVILS